MAKTAIKGSSPQAARDARLAECPLADLRPYASMINHFGVIAPHNITPDDVKRPSYWRNHWRHIGAARWAQITVIAADGSWECWLRVTASGDGFVRVRELFSVEEAQPEESLPESWEAQYVDAGWRVRNGDGAIVTHSHPLKSIAVQSANDLIRRVR